VRTPQEAFRAYYESMTDSDLLAIARNRDSFIPLAQRELAEELRRRQLTAPAGAPVQLTRTPSLFAKLRQILRRGPKEKRT
jgi:hypothetical protein